MRLSVMAGVTLLPLALLGCGDRGPGSAADIAQCQEVEARSYPVLERVAEQALADVDHLLRPVGSCEDTGRPRARVIASVGGWPTRRIGIRFFDGADGWTRDDGGFSTVDGAYRSWIMTARDADAPESYVEVEFTATP